MELKQSLERKGLSQECVGKPNSSVSLQPNLRGENASAKTKDSGLSPGLSASQGISWKSLSRRNTEAWRWRKCRIWLAPSSSWLRYSRVQPPWARCCVLGDMDQKKGSHGSRGRGEAGVISAGGSQACRSTHLFGLQLFLAFPSAEVRASC